MTHLSGCDILIKWEGLFTWGQTVVSRRQLLAVLLAGIMAVLCVPFAAGECVFVAPESVQADGAGQFSFVAILMAGSDCVGFAGYHYQGLENIEASLWVDTFCIDPQPIAPGSTFPIDVDGTLTDPALNGSIYSEAAFCEGGYGSATTLVLAPAVPTFLSSWDRIKACYR